MERTPLTSAVLSYPSVITSDLFVTRFMLSVLWLNALRRLIALMLVPLVLQGGVVVDQISDMLAVVALDATRAVPGCLHGSTAA